MRTPKKNDAAWPRADRFHFASIAMPVPLIVARYRPIFGFDYLRFDTHPISTTQRHVTALNRVNFRYMHHQNTVQLTPNSGFLVSSVCNEIADWLMWFERYRRWRHLYRKPCTWKTSAKSSVQRARARGSVNQRERCYLNLIYNRNLKKRWTSHVTYIEWRNGSARLQQRSLIAGRDCEIAWSAS